MTRDDRKKEQINKLTIVLLGVLFIVIFVLAMRSGGKRHNKEDDSRIKYIGGKDGILMYDIDGHDWIEDRLGVMKHLDASCKHGDHALKK